MSRTLKRIAITGGIATGKSTLLRILSNLGEAVLSCDEIVSELYHQEDLKREIRKLFGGDIFTEEGKVDKEKLLERITREPILKEKLEALVHPAVWKVLQQSFAKLEAKGTNRVFVEVPLLFEAGWEDRFDEVWVVACQKETQRVRLKERAKHALLLDSQIPLEEKIKRAKRIYLTDLSLEDLKKQVERELSQLPSHQEKKETS